MHGKCSRAWTAALLQQSSGLGGQLLPKTAQIKDRESLSLIHLPLKLLHPVFGLGEAVLISDVIHNDSRSSPPAHADKPVGILQFMHLGWSHPPWSHRGRDLVIWG